jgi:hypothetical protein
MIAVSAKRIGNAKEGNIEIQSNMLDARAILLATRRLYEAVSKPPESSGYT